MINIFLYTDSPSESFDINKLISFLSNFNFNFQNRDDLLDFLMLDEQAAADYESFLNAIIVRDIDKPLDKINRKTEYSEPSGNTKGKTLFDGYWLQRKLYTYLFSEINSEETENNNLHLIISGKLFGTYGTKRYHARVLLTGEPAMISTSGIVEAPARPREYYYVKANLLSMGKKTDELDEIYKGRFVEYNDPKITDILCSYVLQIIKGKLTGDPFCQNSDCCLYNSHWQEELLNLQYKHEYCEECSSILESN